ncbi:MAG: acyl carrier protein [Lachnospiraceae bacterium]|nr:acyl carrier protein [Lachnospiraceae bacterium]
MDVECLKRIIAKTLNIRADEIHLETDLMKDLGADSLDIFQIMIEIEEELQIEIHSDEAERVRTVSDIMELVDRFGV